jgi:hypothetical protein
MQGLQQESCANKENSRGFPDTEDADKFQTQACGHGRPAESCGLCSPVLVWGREERIAGRLRQGFGENRGVPAVLAVDVACVGEVEGVGHHDGRAARVLQVHVHRGAVAAGAGAPGLGELGVDLAGSSSGRWLQVLEGGEARTC